MSSLRNERFTGHSVFKLDLVCHPKSRWASGRKKTKKNMPFSLKLVSVLAMPYQILQLFKSSRNIYLDVSGVCYT